MIGSNDETQFILTDITVVTGDLFRTQQSCLRYYSVARSCSTFCSWGGEGTAVHRLLPANNHRYIVIRASPRIDFLTSWLPDAFESTKKARY